MESCGASPTSKNEENKSKKCSHAGRKLTPSHSQWERTATQSLLSEIFKSELVPNSNRCSKEKSSASETEIKQESAACLTGDRIVDKKSPETTPEVLRNRVKYEKEQDLCFSSVSAILKPRYYIVDPQRQKELIQRITDSTGASIRVQNNTMVVYGSSEAITRTRDCLDRIYVEVMNLQNTFFQKSGCPSSKADNTTEVLKEDRIEDTLDNSSAPSTIEEDICDESEVLDYDGEWDLETKQPDTQLVFIPRIKQHIMIDMSGVKGEKHPDLEKDVIEQSQSVFVPEEDPSTKCELCSKHFQTVKMFESHKCSNSENICQYCGMKVRTRHVLYRHMKRCPLPANSSTITDETIEKSPSKSIFRKSLNKNKKKAMNQEKCPSEKRSLLKNTTKKIIKPKNSTEKRQKRKNKEINMKVNGNNKFSCSLCGKEFSQKRYMMTHKLRHDLKHRKWDCSICSRRFFERVKLLQHIETHKPAEKRNLPYRCNQCPKQFCNKTGLTEHTYKHLGKKPYSCPVCSRAFYHKLSAKRHMLVHSEKRPFPCQQCPRAFRHVSELSTHVKRVHRKRSEMVSCTKCAKLFLPEALETHQCWNPTPPNIEHNKVAIFQCGICDEQFSSFEEISAHVPTHNRSSI